MEILPETAREIRLVVLDADGVLTDGSLYMGASGTPAGGLRRFNALDGLAIHMLKQAGLTVAIVSGRSSEAIRLRAAELGIDEIHQVSPFGKIAAVEGILSRNGWPWSAVVHMGDDLADLALFERVGLSVAVVNAVSEVREKAAWCGTVPGGGGAVREFAEALLRARGQWDELVEAYVERGRGT
jgi:3-deoxy-D-manno-octulosonate 8-phosphate phosphatase (KDO 8-P phosphatase)